MTQSLRSGQVRYLALLMGLAGPLAVVAAQDKAVPAGSAVNVTVTAGTAPPPPVSITLHERNAQVTPHKGRHAHTGGGLIEVTSPAGDTVLITMSGAVVADAEMRFELEQGFEVNFDDPKLKKAKVLIEGRVLGLLRGQCLGCAEESNASAQVSCPTAGLAGVSLPPRRVCNCDNLSVNDHDGPHAMPVAPGKYTLNQTFAISANSKCCLLKRPSAEFAPDPAIDPIWINYWEPFHGVKKDNFGFQVILKVVPETEDTKETNGTKKGVEQLPPPQPGQDKP
jgi:hypothetical protein